MTLPNPGGIIPRFTSATSPLPFAIIPAVITFLLLPAGCGETTAPAEAGWEIQVVSGNRQTASVTRPLPDPVVVRLRRSSGPIEGAAVTWTVRDDGCGTVSSTSTRTDEDGFSRNSWTLGETAYTTLQRDCSLTVAPAAQPGVRRRIRARALPGPVARNRYVSGLEISGKIYPEPYTFPGRWLADGYTNPQPFVARIVSGPLFPLGREPGQREARTIKALAGRFGPGPVGSLVDSGVVKLVLADTGVAVVDIDLFRAEGPEELTFVGIVR